MKKVLILSLALAVSLGFVMPAMADVDVGLGYNAWMSYDDVGFSAPMRLDVGRLGVQFGDTTSENNDGVWDYSVNYHHPFGAFFSYGIIGLRGNTDWELTGERLGVGTRFRMGSFVFRVEPSVYTQKKLPSGFDDIALSLNFATQIDADHLFGSLFPETKVEE